MRKKFSILFTLITLMTAFVLFHLEDTAYAHVRVIIGPWPIPIVVFPVVPPPAPLPSPPPPEVAQVGYLNLDVRPQDAKVYVDDEYRGIAHDFDGSPSYLTLHRGQHRITFKKEGYSPVSFIVKVVAGELITLDVTMNLIKESAPSPEEKVYQLDMDSTGYVEFDVSPPDAAVYIDNEFYGTASRFRDVSNTLILRTGAHHIEIIRPGHISYVGDITLKKGERKKMKITLDRKE